MPAELRFSRSDSRQSSSARSVAAPLATARWCATRGWPVFPLAAGRKVPAANCESCRRPGHTHRDCGCRAEGRWCHGFHSATLDTSRIEAWWGSAPAMGVGVSCGPAGLVVIDVDAHQQPVPSRDRLLPGIHIPDEVDLMGLANGYHTLAVLAALRGVVSPSEDESTLRVRTPSGGMHVWYRAVDGRAWQCSTGTSTRRALVWQVDIRAHGGYIVTPGTTTPDGSYMPVGPVREPAPLPGWLAQELERTGHLPAVPAPRPVPPRARQAVLAAGGRTGKATRTLLTVLTEVTECAKTPEGAAFSEKLNRAAYTLGGLVAAGHLDQAEAEHVLLQAAEQARPGQTRRAEQIIRSGMSAGLRRPLEPGSSS
ncbi:bifunctional DNA primase/polymerase [Streptomyces luteolus]|uniref:Bifunctional DNA primase/polymerase n=1 Tax=Streptomyces luteolus TaxID=3043615 RepID=A0ABT6T744_9ACTN|nr:bifunctional DNA primase/polymerase [Streptomyces sp. B-S-A12]MDI3423712.1 bifunctional DNA primase/polymerase [Streptomyces sp. B-S-A12]